MAARVGLEPTASSLTGTCTTVVLPGNEWWSPSESNRDLLLFRQARTPSTPENQQTGQWPDKTSARLYVFVKPRYKIVNETKKTPGLFGPGVGEVGFSPTYSRLPRGVISVPNGLFPAVSVTRQITCASRCDHDALVLSLDDVSMRFMDAGQPSEQGFRVNSILQTLFPSRY